jgi:hypothetical protein
MSKIDSPGRNHHELLYSRQIVLSAGMALQSIRCLCRKKKREPL